LSRDNERTDSRHETWVAWEDVGADTRAVDFNVSAGTDRACPVFDMGREQLACTSTNSHVMSAHALAFDGVPALEQSVRDRMGVTGTSKGSVICSRLVSVPSGPSGGPSGGVPAGGVSCRSSHSSSAGVSKGPLQSVEPRPTKVKSECSVDRFNCGPPVLDKTDPSYLDVPGGLFPAYQGQVKRLGKDFLYHGYGYLSSSHTTMVGQFQNGKPHGQVTQTWPDGRLYAGQFANGLFSGSGHMEWQTPRGVMVYDGQYMADKKHGEGVFLWLSGKKYEGQWQVLRCIGT